jgi:prepilin-type N-terminal cleavage/methylation domain-containing protein/prepilin-type processing-associated H-X9-DG protein
MKRRAFTLIELIVVIGIIALLTAILVPILSSSRENARAVHCGSNIKQLYFAFSLYESENGTFPYAFNLDTPYPPTGGYPGNIMYDKAGWWWLNYIADYSRSDFNKDSIVWCPSRQIKDIRLEYNVLCGNYGVNQSICKSSDNSENKTEFIGKPLSCTEISNPGMTLLVVDSGYGVIKWWHVTDNPPEALGTSIEDRAFIPGLWINKNKNIWRGLEDDAVYGRHPGRTVNIGFAGGNINRIKADNLFVEKTGDSYKNKNPLWVPE